MKPLFKLLAMISAAALVYAPCRAADILLVLSGGEGPYRQTSALLSEQLNAQGHRVQEAILEDSGKTTRPTTGQELTVAIGSKAALAMKETASASCPLVFCMVSDPAMLKLDQMAHVWGVSMEIPVKDQFQLIAEALPGPRTIGLMYQSSTEAGRQWLKEIESKLPNKTWRLEAVAIDDKKYRSVSDAIKDLFDRKIDMVWTYPDAAIFNNATVQQILLTSIRNKTPVYGYSSGFVKAGALMGTSINLNKHGQQTVRLVQGITGHDRPKSPILLPEYDLVLNQIVAERLSITLPEGIVAKADIIYRPGDVEKEEKR